MPRHAIFALIVSAALGASTASADDKYAFHENLHIGQKVTYTLDLDSIAKYTTTTKGKATVTEIEHRQSWKMNVTVLAVENGSAVRQEMQFDPHSTDMEKEVGKKETNAPCPFIGAKIIVTRHADQSVTNNFRGNASDNDTDMLNQSLDPDQDYYPDHPVAVGDSWDNSVKLSKHAELGSADLLSSRCRLDWVKTVDDKQIAQISVSEAIINYEDGHVESDSEIASTFLVDMARGMIVKSDTKQSTKYSTPTTEPTQLTGGEQVTVHCEVAPEATTEPATQP